MLDADIVAVSPSSVCRVLSQARLLSKWNGKPSKKGTGFAQSLAAHQHWHIGVFLPERRWYLLLPVQHPGRLQPVHRAMGRPEAMTEADIEIILQGAKEKYPEAAMVYYDGM